MKLIGVNQIMTKFFNIIQFLVHNNYEQSPFISILYVDSPVTIGTLHIGQYEVLYWYTSAVLSVVFITMKFVP